MPNVLHRIALIDGIETFYREAGPADAPVLLLPHGYPCSSYEFRNLIPRLADRWRLLAPDFPGCGYSGTPEGFAYDFDGYARFLEQFAEATGAQRFALYLHDFGSQIGLRLAIRRPARIAALIVQNGDIYEDQLGPGYDPLKTYWANPTPAEKAKLAEAITLEGYRHEFLNGSEGNVGARIPPDLWTLHWALTDERRRAIALEVIAGLKENRDWFPRYQAWLREHRPPTLILWGPNDSYMPAGAARAYLRDLPDAEVHLFEDGGHWLLETHLDQAVERIRDFLGRVHTA
ncbi:alpha/beta hydrolase [Brevundimonas sp. BR2-1]|uniref:alpha/beta fold hydrolase n=1 Tax=Brevundimonas sp. BR2-1 TaxID=3031123 RepID=UPI0030B61CF1